MQEFKEKVTALVETYEERLAAKGIQIAVSKRYFETDVAERSDTDVFTTVGRAFDRKREKEMGYHYIRNRYHCIVLSVVPTEKDAVRREHCKEYAFVFKKVERAHVGLEPEKVTYAENKVMAKIEKRLVRILKKSERNSVEKVCRDTVLDAIRYTSLAKYGYRRHILGKERSTWEWIFLLSFGGFVLVLIGLLWLMRVPV